MGRMGKMGGMGETAQDAPGVLAPVEPQGAAENARNRSARVRSEAFGKSWHETQNAILQWGEDLRHLWGEDPRRVWGEYPRRGIE